MFEKISVPSNATKQLNIQVPGHSFDKCVISVEDYAIRMRPDNQDPDSSTGVKFPIGSIIKLTSRREIVGARFIGIGGIATLNVSYLGQ
jgi:hypothetical protein